MLALLELQLEYEQLERDRQKAMEVLTYERNLLDPRSLTAHNGGGEQFQTALSAPCCFNGLELVKLSFFPAR